MIDAHACEVVLLNLQNLQTLGRWRWSIAVEGGELPWNRSMETVQAQKSASKWK